MLRHSLCVVSMLVASFPVAAQDARRPITFEDLWKIQRVGRPSLSPDGKWAVVELTSYRLEDDSSSSNLWLLATDGSAQKQLTHTTKGKNSGPVWSPDGSLIAFVAKRTGDVAQIHVIAPDGGEARAVSKLPTAPFGLKWRADSKAIFCIVSTWPDAPDGDAYTKREKERKESKVQAYIIDDAQFRLWDTWLADGKRPLVFRVDLASGAHVNLFTKTHLFLPPVFAGDSSFDISPDGKNLAFTAETTKVLGTDFNSDIYVMSAETPSAPKNLTTDNPASDFAPVYSPDGSRLAFLRQTTKYFYADRVRLMMRDLSEGRHVEWTSNVDRSVSSPTWLPDGKAIVVDVEDAGYHRLLAVTGPGQHSWLTKGYSDNAPIAAGGGVIAFLRTSFDFPSQLWVARKGQAPIRIDRFNDALTSQWDLGKVEEVRFPGADNEEVQMWIVFPPQFDPKKKWPLIQFVHGGPHNGIVTSFHFRWNVHLFASKGYVVSVVNFHGSSGFGQKFTDSITGDMATKPFEDVMKGTAFMEKTGFIDPNRMAAVGASYGGYMMAWINGHTDKFKAMVCHAGVYNWHSMMASDFVKSRERPLGGLPWGGDLAKIDRQTPQRFAAQFKTPTLVTHGEKDYRVPVTQGFEYYNTLRLKGVPCRLIYFPDENHWILKSQNARLWTREVFDWLEKYIGHGPTRP